MSNHRWFLLPAILGIAVASFFLVRAAGDASVYYLYTSEAVAARENFSDNRRFRIAGTVVPGTLSPGQGESTFDISDGIETVNIRLVSLPPPLFQEDVEVLLEGAWIGEVFEADEALIRHEAEYQAPATGNAPDLETG
ncbi:MAG TPA: cytochrome c maturation protein CcmE [Acidimicrobiia bacterium]|nr:cytochrome c maturation protein CcmE [Acidimicrobiia bacterium]